MSTPVPANDDLPTVPLDSIAQNLTLPADYKDGTFIGRVWLPNADPKLSGPAVVTLDKDGYLVDITSTYQMVSDLLDAENPAQAAQEAINAPTSKRLAKFSDVLRNTPQQKKDTIHLLSPIDTQAVKAAGVTFAPSLIERTVEKLAGGDPAKADEVRTRLREQINAIVGPEVMTDLSKLEPGSEKALKLRDMLLLSITEARISEAAKEVAHDDQELAGKLSEKLRKQVQDIIKLENGEAIDQPLDAERLQKLKKFMLGLGIGKSYIEVGLGKDAEIFTKAQPMATVGHGSWAGFLPESTWNNPEPEVVLAINTRGQIVGAALGNDINHRDIEGRSELLLGECKDQNATAVVGPMIRLIDGQSFTQDHIDNMKVGLSVRGADGFTLEESSFMNQISRKPVKLVEQMFHQHQYPDGAVLYCGTMFAPTKDRGQPGMGFTHHEGDIVTVKSDKLGSLTNAMVHTDKAPKWEFGTRALAKNLAARELLTALAAGVSAGKWSREEQIGTQTSRDSMPTWQL